MNKIRTRKSRAESLAVAIGALALAAGSAHAAGLVNISLVAVPGAEAGTTTPFAINNSGEIAGQYLDPAVGYRVFALNGGAYATVDPGPAVAQNGSYFASLNNAGQILGFANTTTAPNYGYYYLANGQGALAGFPPPSSTLPTGTLNYSAYNDNGAVAGQVGNVAFVSQGGMITTIDPATTTYTYINAINDTGGVVGQFNPAAPPSPYANQDAFVYENGAYTTLAPPGARFTEATGINDKGVVVGYFDAAPVTASDGDQVTPIEGFTYENGVYREYSVPGEVETELFGINNSGEVVGYYGDEEGDASGFSALAAPEPGVWALMLVGFGGLGVALRGSRRQAVAPAA
jgi:uncharacterized membrane protein